MKTHQQTTLHAVVINNEPLRLDDIKPVQGGGNIMQLFTFIQSFLATQEARSERGAGLAEYALLLVIIAVACLTALGTLSTAIQGAYGSISGALN